MPTVYVMVTVPDAARLAIVHVSVAPARVHPAGAGAGVIPAGSVSVTVMPLVFDRPLFVTVNV